MIVFVSEEKLLSYSVVVFSFGVNLDFCGCLLLFFRIYYLERCFIMAHLLNTITAGNPHVRPHRRMPL